MFDGFDALCEKYACSYANLVQAYTLSRYEQLNLLTGFRHVETMRDTCKVFDIALSEEDRKTIEALADRVREA